MDVQVRILSRALNDLVVKLWQNTLVSKTGAVRREGSSPSEITYLMIDSVSWGNWLDPGYLKYPVI